MWGLALPLLGAGLSYLGARGAEKKADRANARSEQLERDALAFDQQRYAERAPLRKLGMNQAMDQRYEDLGGLFASSNPMAARNRAGIRPLGPSPDVFTPEPVAPPPVQAGPSLSSRTQLMLSGSSAGRQALRKLGMR